MVGSLGGNQMMQGPGQEPDNSAFNRFSQVQVPKWMQAQGIGSMSDPRAMSYMNQNPQSQIAQNAGQALNGGQPQPPMQPMPQPGLQPMPGGPMQPQPTGNMPPWASYQPGAGKNYGNLGSWLQQLGGGQGPKLGGPQSINGGGLQAPGQGPQQNTNLWWGDPANRAALQGAQGQQGPQSMLYQMNGGGLQAPPQGPQSMNGGGFQVRMQPAPQGPQVHPLNPSVGAPPPGQIKSVNGGGLQAPGQMQPARPPAPSQPSVIRADRGMNQTQTDQAIKASPMASTLAARRRPKRLQAMEAGG